MSNSLIFSFESYLHNKAYRLETVRGHSNTVKGYLTWLTAQEVPYEVAGYQDILSYIKACRNNKNIDRTINLKLISLKHFYAYLIQEKIYLAINPVAELHLKGAVKRKPHDILEMKSLEEIYQSFPAGNLAGKRNKVILGIMIYQGLSQGELTRLTIDDINLLEAKIYIPSIKRSNSRELPLVASQIIAIQQYLSIVRPMILKQTNKASNCLFVSLGNGEQLANSFSILMTKLKKLHPSVKNQKQIRASVLTHWLTIYNIREVQYMAGHRYVSSTQHYKTNHLKSLQEQIDRLHPLKETPF